MKKYTTAEFEELFPGCKLHAEYIHMELPVTIADQVEIGQDVHLKSGVHLGVGVIILDHVHLMSDVHIDAGALIGIPNPEGMRTIIQSSTWVGSHVYIYAGTTIGRYTSIGAWSNIGASTKNTLGSSVKIDAACRIGERNNIQASTQLGVAVTTGNNVILERGCLIGPACQIDSGCILGADVHLVKRVHLHGNVVLGIYSYIGGGVTIGRNSTLPDQCRVSCDTQLVAGVRVFESAGNPGGYKQLVSMQIANNGEQWIQLGHTLKRRSAWEISQKQDLRSLDHNKLLSRAFTWLDEHKEKL